MHDDFDQVVSIVDVVQQHWNLVHQSKFEYQFIQLNKNIKNHSFSAVQQISGYFQSIFQTSHFLWIILFWLHRYDEIVFHCLWALDDESWNSIWNKCEIHILLLETVPDWYPVSINW